MGNRLVGLTVAVVAVFAILPALLAQTPARPGPATPRAQATTTPDLSGVWVGDRAGAVFPREAPAMTPQTEETYNYNKNPRNPEGGGRAELNPGVQCQPVGLTWLLLNTRGGGAYVEIMQSPRRVMMLFEYDHWIRQIWTDGREHPKPLELFFIVHDNPVCFQCLVCIFINKQLSSYIHNCLHDVHLKK